MNETKNRSTISFLRLFVKVGILLLIINFGWILISKVPFGRISIYNHFIDGRFRFPFGENPGNSYNLSLYDLNAMFASHVVNDKSKISDGDIKIFLIGDSSIWGFLQKPDQTITGLLNKEFSNRNKDVEFYNLGYPSISVLKDLMLIDMSLDYKPDLIIWFTTLEALPIDIQLDTPLIKNNPQFVNQLLNEYNLNAFPRLKANLLQNTMFNKRRNISDIIRLQIYGFLWNATGIDQEYPEKYRPAQRDFDPPLGEYHGMSSDENIQTKLALSVIKKGIIHNTETDFIIVNEPILISNGLNSSTQYDFYYPRWAYDQYRQIMDKFTKDNKIIYYDLWNLVPENMFTNSAIHLSQSGEKILTEKIIDIVDQYLGNMDKNE